MYKMYLTTEEIKKLSKKSCLKIDNKEILQTKKQLDICLNVMNKISLINTNNIKPLYNISNKTQILQEDSPIKKDFDNKYILKNAPSIDHENKLFLVPTFLSK
uniref:Aspartyl glutamyl-tRNA Asn Gln amidotransferase subunit C n=1 Tax=uncultured organism TaxID=155900 RepID=G8DB30_9ZZZZ|nr:aspartyl glutamyl-tRNA Asn Gln amidotransferase subunit C [uncultured organism]